MASENKPYLDPINFDENVIPENLSIFSKFPLLPKELRVKIWRHVLGRNRMIDIRLEAQEDILASRLAEHRGQPATQVAADSRREKYRAIVCGHRVLSKLLRVSRESREETLRFYRVHIPCTFTDATGIQKGSGTFHFNPEFDFLQLRPSWPIKDTLLDFLYRLKTELDPRHVGLLNLAIDRNGMLGHDMHSLLPSSLEQDVRTAVTQTLTNLVEVFFVSSVRVGRQTLGYKSGIGFNDHMYHRSFPIHATSPTFKRLQQDPRDIGEDLKKTHIGDAPAELVRYWKLILRKFGVSFKPLDVEYRFLLTFDPSMDGGPITDRHAAEKWIQKENERWETESDGRHLDETLENLVRPVFGFWLFPLEIRDSAVLDEPSQLQLMDLSRHLPELGCIDFT